MAASPAVQVGDVFFLRCKLCDPPKNKHFVVVHADPLKMLIVNSRANEFQLANPAIMRVLAHMRVSEHAFMDHDSLIGCHHLSHEYQLDELLALLKVHPDIHLGRLSQNAFDAVRTALRANEFIPVKYLRLLDAFWGCLPKK